MIKTHLDSIKKRLHVEVKDDVTSSHVNKLQTEINRVVTESPESDWDAFYLDLRACRMVDSVGINWLFAECTRMKSMKKKFIVRISSPAINRVMEFSGLDKLVILKFRRRKQTR